MKSFLNVQTLLKVIYVLKSPLELPPLLGALLLYSKLAGILNLLIEKRNAYTVGIKNKNVPKFVLCILLSIHKKKHSIENCYYNFLVSFIH